MAYLVEYGYEELKEVETIGEVNDELSKGWDIIGTYTKHVSGSLSAEDYIMIYVLGKRSVE